MRITTAAEYDAACVIAGMLHEQRHRRDLCEDENLMLGVLEEALDRYEDNRFPIDTPLDEDC